MAIADPIVLCACHICHREKSFRLYAALWGNDRSTKRV